MGLFGRGTQYDRTIFLRRAREELRNGKYKRALPLLRQIMAREPNNPELHALIAPALAARGHDFEAWESYQTAAQALYKHGNKAAALELHTDATRRLPHLIDTWVRRAELERELTRQDAALKTLLAGRKRFAKRRSRPQAISLLRRALEINPKAHAVILDLAGLLARTDQKDEALFHLESLAQKSRGENLKAVCKAQWAVLPSLANTWRWMRAG
ncbi:MAG: tetratricopeptide repeat protein [Deltaproteobacteria bacterium]|jgi:thioredoxin-like negative regulator of GroEL|nr:tetratricopeptide repeat protein [Deltaproteobacteria bacterium]MBW2389095.1 tetratricopeptide repeat protein [Deltaproteobacteria bacterium]